MKKQLNSFKFAIKGVLHTIESEGHMRFHMVAAFFVLLFSSFYDFSAGELALLILLIASVMAAEVVNTSIEKLCDFVTDQYEPAIKFVKDAAAGAVLILSVAAVVVAVIFFADFAVIQSIIKFFSENIILTVLLVIFGILCAFFVRFGPSGIRKVISYLKK